MSDSLDKAKFPRKNKISSDSVEILTGGTRSQHFGHFVPKIVGDWNPLNQSKIKIKAFTLAEVLITLVIIGVVAALTIPSVITNYKDKQYNTARLKALKTFGEAGKMASINEEMNTQTNATDFVSKVLSKYLKITKVCDNAADCGFPNEVLPSNTNATRIISDNIKTWANLYFYNYTYNNYTDMGNNKLSTYVMTTDGYSAKIFYNPKCARNSHDNPVYSCDSQECETRSVDGACLNVIYDMNGRKAPNHAGEDIGIVTVFWSGLKSVAVAPGIIPYKEAKALFDEGYKSVSNGKLLCEQHSYVLPDIDEIASLVLNQKFSSTNNGSYFWSRTPVSGKQGYNWIVVVHTRSHLPSYYGSSIWCVRR